MDNLSEEEKKAIEYTKNVINTIEQSKTLFNEDLTVKLGTTSHNNFQILLNLIEKQDEEIKHWKKELEKVLTENKLIG